MTVQDSIRLCLMVSLVWALLRVHWPLLAREWKQLQQWPGDCLQAGFLSPMPTIGKVMGAVSSRASVGWLPTDTRTHPRLVESPRSEP